VGGGENVKKQQNKKDDENKAEHTFLNMNFTVQLKTHLLCGSKLIKSLCYTEINSGC
jgi:hypothetical protein